MLAATGSASPDPEDATGLSRGVLRLLLPDQLLLIQKMPRACPVEFHVRCYGS
jgi:hypothetical protein